jgi:peptide/nickel transport system permease protein
MMVNWRYALVLRTLLAGNRGALAGFVGLVVFVVIAVLGPWVVPLDMTPRYQQRFQPPSMSHVLGTDYAGRDIAQQMVAGTGDILLIAFSTGLFATLLALLIGMAAGLGGKRTDALLTGVIDIFLTVPNFPIMAIFAALFQIRNPIQFGFVLSLWAWPPLARAIRSQVLTLKRREFVEVANVMAMGWTSVVCGELLPNMMPFVTINFITMAKNAITASAGIMLLGLVPLRVQNWGMMLNLAVFQSGAIYIPHAYTYVLAPMLAIVLFQYCLVRFASGIDEIFDPRLRAW